MILVTGGAGYIGSHLALNLLEKGYKVLVFDNLSTGHKETLEILKNIGKENFKYIIGDLTNIKEVEKCFNNPIDAVFHFAALSCVEESVLNPEKYRKNNVEGSLNLLNAMKKFNTDKIIFSSTAAVYGEPNYIPIDENHPCKPINPYGKTKFIIENLMDDYDKNYNIKSARLRYFNVAGADSKIRIGELHNPETHLIPNILKSVLNKDSKTLEIYGNDYDTRDGTCIRDYINIEDLVCAHILAYKYLINGGKTDYFNLGGNENKTVKEIIELCKEITGENIPFKIKQKRMGDVSKLTADNSKAKAILNWEPSYSIKDSIKSAYLFLKKEGCK